MNKTLIRVTDGETTDPGEVVVALIPGGVFDRTAGSAGHAAGLGGRLLAWDGVLDKGVLAALAVAALAMMVLMVRKAGRKGELPTAEEIVGIPPALETQSDVVGEADESETAMEGFEVGDDQVKTQKLLEQVTELVKQNPEGGASLLNRWIKAND
jgi:hypothetical protein